MITKWLAITMRLWMIHSIMMLMKLALILKMIWDSQYMMKVQLPLIMEYTLMIKTISIIFKILVFNILKPAKILISTMKLQKNFNLLEILMQTIKMSLRWTSRPRQKLIRITFKMVSSLKHKCLEHIRLICNKPLTVILTFSAKKVTFLIWQKSLSKSFKPHFKKD